MEDRTEMAKKEQKKPAKKPKTTGAAKAKKAAAPAKKTAAPKKKAAPNGVMQWLQQGLLKGQQDAKGGWQVDASNLEVANVKRLVR
jgi:hypothetical protein